MHVGVLVYMKYEKSNPSLIPVRNPCPELFNFFSRPPFAVIWPRGGRDSFRQFSLAGLV